MPFDNTTLRQLTVTILPPPTPPEHGGHPRRIRIEIEIVDRRHPRKIAIVSGYRFGAFTLALLALLLLTELAHAEDRAVNNSLHYDHWESTSGWQGETRTQGSTTDWDAYGPDGRQKHCHRYFVGETAYTTPLIAGMAFIATGHSACRAAAVQQVARRDIQHGGRPASRRY